MTIHEIRVRRLQIAVQMGVLAEQDVGLRRQMLEVEAASATLTRELAQLDLAEADFAPVISRRERETTINGHRLNSEDSDGS